MDLLNRLENYYAFECPGGPLKNCTEWQQLRKLLEAIQGEAAAYCEEHDGCERIRQLAGQALTPQ